MDTSTRQPGTLRHGLISLAMAALAIFGAAPALADSALATCGFTYTAHDYFSDSSDTRNNSSVTCSDARFGTLSSSATVSGTSLGAYVGIDWNRNPPTRVPDEGYSATARAILLDTMFIPGSGRGTMTVNMPVHGMFANSPYLDLLAVVVVQAGDYSGDGSNVWQTYYSSSVHDTFIFPLSMPLGESFTFYTQLQIWGGTVNGHGADYTDGFADFSNTVEVSITRLQDGSGADIPLNTLQVISGSGRVFTATAPIPEPETWALLLAGFGALGFAARRRKQKEAA